MSRHAGILQIVPGKLEEYVALYRGVWPEGMVGHCIPCQNPLPDRAEGEWWASLEEVFHTD